LARSKSHSLLELNHSFTISMIKDGIGLEKLLILINTLLLLSLHKVIWSEGIIRSVSNSLKLLATRTDIVLKVDWLHASIRY
jgi:hypothetical protein